MTRRRWLWLAFGALVVALAGIAGHQLTQGHLLAMPIGVNTFVGPGSVATPEPPTAASLPFEILVDGDSNGSYPSRQEVITTAADWQRYWREVHAKVPVLPPLLPVDFAVNQVVALSEGPRSTGGYHVKVTGIAAATSGAIVYVTESKPGAGCMVTQSITNRYFLVRTHLLTPPVNFRITTEQRDCH